MSEDPEIITPEKLLNSDFVSTVREFELQSGEKVELPGFHIKDTNLYYGSDIVDLSELRHAQATTIGWGVYLTSTFNAARSYALVRGLDKNRGSVSELSAAVYKVNLKDLEIVNLFSKDALKDFSKLYVEYLIKILKERKATGQGDEDALVFYLTNRGLQRRIKDIQLVKVPNLKHLGKGFGGGKFVTSYLSSLGYDGLMAFEGGEYADYLKDEETNTINVGKHDSYVIFDPAKLKVVGEERVTL